ncbi:hypothetical protein [Thalassospira sp. MCCC 1A01428]|uniref:hypothetical protein n=1 Tax=Thalassospira sp. MCCC 1A01428 TaxID=1470575 RepID=UPI000A1F3CC2|nr:hypothetical protein [Thalassospira sp. MCCC 1A01428]OSQ33817.1 hypothetical protein THS27_25890 [Thalassospira sp. MCCC 1A01428]
MEKTNESVVAQDRKVVVAGKAYFLVPNLNALRGINAALGGLAPAFTKVRDLNFDAMATVLVSASGMKPGAAEFDELVRDIWQAENKAEIGGALSDYLVVMLNGGRNVRDDADSGDAGGTPGKS